MEVGKVIPLFPTFGKFCEYARIAPHVLPHDFAGSLEGYFQVLEKYTFIITSKIDNPVLPFAETMFHVQVVVLKYAYPRYGGPVNALSSEIYPTLPDEAKRELQTEAALQAYRELPGRCNEVFNYLAEAADKLVSFFSGYSMSTPPRKTLREVPPHITLSPPAAGYLAKSTFQPLQNVPEIVNPIVSDMFPSPGTAFPRLRQV
jgi:hypothetical protein